MTSGTSYVIRLEGETDSDVDLMIYSPDRLGHAATWEDDRESNIVLHCDRLQPDLNLIANIGKMD